MPLTQKHLNMGRSSPAAATNTTLYTAPASTTALLQCLHICNTSATDDQVRVFIVPNGDSAGIANAIIYNLIIQGSPARPFALNLLPVLNAGDFIVVYSLNATSTFTLSGIEVTGSSNQTYKKLGQTLPGSASNVTLYTAPANTVALLQSLICCNIAGTSTDLIRVFIVPSGDAAGVTNAIVYDLSLTAGNFLGINTVPDLNAGDSIVVRAQSALTTFTLSGLELS